jgi:cyanophycin synthetase
MSPTEQKRISPEEFGVKIESIRALRGPNLFAYMPVLQIVMDVGPYEERGSDSFPGFTERLVAWLPGLEKHQCSVGRPGGFIERLRRGTYLGHISEHITLELQTLMGFNVSYGRARGTGRPGVYNVVIAYREEEPARRAFDTALRLTLAAMHDLPFDVEGEIEELLQVADEYRLGPSTGAIVDAARKRRIPVLRISPSGSLVQLGYGVHQRRIQASETSLTSSIAVDMCQEKPLTNKMLRTVGVPVPDGRTVVSEDDAWLVAQSVGLPVVVKPADGNQGKGVSVNLNSEAEVRAAYQIARSTKSGDVLVEQFMEGADHRLLVVNGKMVAAARRDPAQVVGDGEHTVAELVEEVNKDPRRRPGHSSTLTRIRLDEAAELVLSQQGLTTESVPEPGQVVRLRNNSNLSTGGTATDVTDEVHPRNAQVAELAAQILALDVAGIDIVCKDISRPLGEQRGAIVEVNAAPGLRMHLAPAVGQPRDVGKAIVDMLYPEGEPSRIPIIAVTGTNGKTTVTRLVSHMYETARWVVGMTSTEGTYINKERVLEGDCSGPKSAQAVLLHPNVEVAVLETARGGILREGLAFDQCLVGIVTNISSDHLGLGGVNTLEELARVKQVVIESVASDGTAVLNAEDPLVAEMAAATDAEVIYFSADPNNHIIQAHIAEGGRCVFIEDGYIVLMRDGQRNDLVELERVEFTANGQIGFQVQNALAATAAAWAAGLNPAMIARALTTFKTDMGMVPGRFNVSELNGVQVVLDYGHNQAAVKAMMQGVKALGERNTVMVIGLPGDRRDQDITATFEETLPYVNHYVLHDLKDRRERAKDEVPRLMANSILPGTPYDIADDQREAVFKAWEKVKPGDRMVIVADIVDETYETLQSLAESKGDSSCESPLSSEQQEPRDGHNGWRIQSE